MYLPSTCLQLPRAAHGDRRPVRLQCLVYACRIQPTTEAPTLGALLALHKALDALAAAPDQGEAWQPVSCAGGPGAMLERQAALWSPAVCSAQTLLPQAAPACLLAG